MSAEGQRFTRPRARTYLLDGQRVPGVTTVLGVLDKTALVNWASEVTASHAVENWDRLAGMTTLDRLKELKGARFAVNKKAVVSGKRIHEMAERVAKGEQVEVPHEFKNAVEAYARTLDEWELEAVALETPCAHSEYRYAGTFDGLLYSPKLGTVVADIKGLALDTPIPTPTGWTTMGDVQVGDEVFAADGSPCTVTLKSPVKRIGTYVVHFDDGSEVVCDAEHLWWTQGSREKAPTVKSVGEVIDTLTRYGQKNHRVPVAGPLDLPGVDLPIDPYLLGCWLGDGSRGGGEITKGSDLFELLEADGHELGVVQPCHSDQCVTRTVYGLRTQLIANELTHNKHIPTQYLRSSRAQRLALLQGLMDTDGSWNTARDRAVFVSTDEALAGQVFELLATLGQRPHLSSAQRSGFGLTVTAYDVEWTPVGIEPFRLPRKAAKVKPKRNLYPATRRMIVAVEPGPDVETACIGVDSWNHTYLCGLAMIPTHNTGKRIYPETALQLAAYRHTDLRLEEVPQVGPRGGVRPSLWVEKPMSPVDGAIGIHIAQDSEQSPASVEILPIQAGEQEFDTFLHLLEVHETWIKRTGFNYRNDASYDNPIGEPIYPEGAFAL